MKGVKAIMSDPYQPESLLQRLYALSEVSPRVCPICGRVAEGTPIRSDQEVLDTGVDLGCWYCAIFMAQGGLHDM